MTEAPSRVDDAQLKELHIKLDEPNEPDGQPE
jgi:aspartyl-tRNA synthetase